MPDYDEKELKEKLKGIENEHAVENISFWPTVFKRVVLIIVFIATFMAIKGVVSNYIRSDIRDHIGEDTDRYGINEYRQYDDNLTNVSINKTIDNAVLNYTSEGDAAAQYNLGVTYDSGYGVTQDSVQAVHWYSRAADQ